VPFEETLINLGHNREVLLKSVEDSAIPQLPLKIQIGLVAEARKVSTQLTALLASLLTTRQNEKGAAESAATARASSAEVDAYRTRASGAVAELEQTRTAYGVLLTEFGNFRTQTELVIKLGEDSQKISQDALESRSHSELARVTKAIEEKEASLTAAVTVALAGALELFRVQGQGLVTEVMAAELARAQTSSAQLISSKGAFEVESAGLLTKTRESLRTTEALAQSFVDDSQLKTNERFSELLKLEDVIREKIRLATNFQLFHAFQTRQMAIVVSKEFWRNALFAIVGLSFILSCAFVIYLFLSNPSYNVAFF
jgi:hypothetical protein